MEVRVHDGSGIDDGDESVKGVRVSGVYEGSIGDYVMVTGASSCAVKSSSVIRLLIPRSASDIITPGVALPAISATTAGRKTVQAREESL